MHFFLENGARVDVFTTRKAPKGYFFGYLVTETLQKHRGAGSYCFCFLDEGQRT